MNTKAERSPSNLLIPGFQKKVLSFCLIFFCLTFLARPLSAAEWHPAEAPLKTRWAADVSLKKPLPEYPRPQMVRSSWLNLNGLWNLAITPKDARKVESFPTQILVPFPVESALSGVMKMVSENERLWYHRTFD